ncbi:GTP cyclohydrolase FolE2 [Microvenator marinus]|uniref:GTP cyclohydrolase FolE2 n=1 Tax=Microvenator marinus TaxID=2600177 RepID=UPI003D321522
MLPSLPLESPMEDVQNRSDNREIPIDRVGVTNLRYPIIVWDKANESQSTVATLSLSVHLPHHFKGTHMSRFLEVLNEHRGEFTIKTLPTVIHELKTRLDSEAAHIEARFPYFIEKQAPVTKKTSLLDIEGYFHGASDASGDDFILGVSVPVTSLCPCSKEISDYGAHNQRSTITIEIRMTSAASEHFVWMEDLIEIAEASASAPLYALLKRPDERFVTMQAYDNPAFVEDIARNVAKRLQDDERIGWFRVKCVNQESIHNHDAFSEILWTRPTES